MVLLYILNSVYLCFSCVDQEQLDKEINDLRKGLKGKVNHINEIQGMKRIPLNSLGHFLSANVKEFGVFIGSMKL